jgi:hypothetical protein
MFDHYLFDFAGGVDASFVWFKDTRVLGPFHPIDEMKFHGDEVIGGEISADVKLDLLWKKDSSIDVTCNASMNADDDSLSVSKTVNVPAGSVESVTVDFKTAEIEPDRVNIHFTATN